MISGPEFDAYLAKLDEFEGRCHWMYLDGPGNVTVGCGHLIPNADAATLLGLSAAEYDQVKTMPAGQLAAYYEDFTHGRVTDAEIDAIKQRDVSAAWTQLAARWPACEGFPIGAQVVVLDMSYNMGVGKFYSEFLLPTCRFGPACERGAWATASAECERKGIQASRNDWAAETLKACAAPAAAT